MPDMDGIGLSGHLRQNFPTTDVYAFTGGSRRMTMPELKQHFDSIFFKPSDYSRMIAEIMKSLAIKKYPFLG